MCRTDYRIRVDGFAQNGKFCSEYDSTSVIANRKALRTTANDVATELGLTTGVDYDVVALATKCNMPPDGITGPGKNRKRLRTIITVSLMSDMPGNFLAALRQKVDAGIFANLADQLGAGKWVPKPFTYNNGAETVCLPQYTSISGACGGPWRPNQITPIPY